MDLIEDRSPQEKLIIAKTLIEGALQELPCPKPETAQNVSNNDLVSRKMAIEEIFNADLQIYEGDWAVGRRNYMTKEECCEIIDSLPSAQTEIITCKDCKHGMYDVMCKFYWCHGAAHSANWFCADGKRRE